MSAKTQRIYYALFFLYSSIALTFRVWIPSFSTILNITSKEIAALLVAVYGCFLTCFRFMFTYWSPDTAISLRRFSLICIIVLAASLFLYKMQMYLIMIFGSSILMGIIFSPFYPYLYALPSKYGLTLTTENSFNMMIFYAAGEAGTCAIIGELMARIHPLMLFVSLFILAIANYILMNNTISEFQ